MSVRFLPELMAQMAEASRVRARGGQSVPESSGLKPRTVVEAQTANRRAIVGDSAHGEWGAWSSAREEAIHYATVHAILDDPNTKRILFDGRQALLFGELSNEGERVPTGVQQKLHPPFPQFYMEFTAPILLPAQEPGKQDRLRSLLFEQDVLQMEIPYQPSGPDDIVLGAGRVGKMPDVVAIDPEEKTVTIKLPLSRITFFLTDETTYVDRTFEYSFDTGQAFVSVGNAVDTGSTLGEFAPDLEKVSAHLIPACGALHRADGREMGWWEEWTHMAAGFLSYVFSYLMAKSVYITAEPMSRQQRRWHERKHKAPKPWHIVKVEPKFSSHRPTDEGGGSPHSYRYDVIGHLRFGKHKKGDGSYSSTIEWVPSHQRGLANSLYIPKTYKVERGKVVSGKMKEYWGEHHSI